MHFTAVGVSRFGTLKASFVFPFPERQGARNVTYSEALLIRLNNISVDLVVSAGSAGLHGLYFFYRLFSKR